MLRVTLRFDDGAFELPLGETVVGRDPACLLRFNDSTISRRHLRFRVDRGEVWVEDLGSKNGLTVNGRALTGRHLVRHGDEIEIGSRRLVAEVESDDLDAQPGTETDPGRSAALRSLAGGATLGAAAPAAVTHVNCARCGALVATSTERCQCGMVLPAGMAFSLTGQIPRDLVDKALERRRERRVETHLLVVYSSETLMFEAVVTNLSRRGAFVASELLEPPGTACGLTLLPDGASPVHLSGRVVRVIEEVSEHERQIGLGIALDPPAPAADQWLAQQLLAHEGGAGSS